MFKNPIINIVFSLLIVTMMLMDIFGEVSIWIYGGIALLYLLIHAYGSFVLDAQFFLPVKFKGEANTQAIALTFDDGPIAGKTEKILDILKSKNVSAAFFCIGSRVRENPDLMKRIYHEGHVIGNHSYWHGKTFDLQSASKIFTELKDTDQAIHRSIGVTPRFFRPPYGVTNPMVASAVAQSQHTTIGWSKRSFDTVIKDSSRLLKRITSSANAGDVVLFHDYSDSMIEILPAYIDHISKIGLKIVRIDKLLNEKPYA